MTSVHTGPASSSSAPQRFRIIVEGRLGPGTESWFEDAEIIVTDAHTEFIVFAADQAALHGILRRVHDLHLKLIAVTPLDFNAHPTNE